LLRPTAWQTAGGCSEQNGTPYRAGRPGCAFAAAVGRLPDDSENLLVRLSAENHFALNLSAFAFGYGATSNSLSRRSEAKTGNSQPLVPS
jgi:hypothetical protein